MWDEKGCHRSLSVRKISVLLSKSKNDSQTDNCKSLHGYISSNDSCHKSILEKNLFGGTDSFSASITGFSFNFEMKFLFTFTHQQSIFSSNNYIESSVLPIDCSSQSFQIGFF